MTNPRLRRDQPHSEAQSHTFLSQVEGSYKHPEKPRWDGKRPRVTWCFPCAVSGNATPATETINGDPMCSHCADRERTGAAL